MRPYVPGMTLRSSADCTLGPRGGAIVGERELTTTGTKARVAKSPPDVRAGDMAVPMMSVGDPSREFDLDTCERLPPTDSRRKVSTARTSCPTTWARPRRRNVALGHQRPTRPACGSPFFHELVRAHDDVVCTARSGSSRWAPRVRSHRRRHRTGGRDSCRGLDGPPAPDKNRLVIPCSGPLLMSSIPSTP